MSESQKSFLKKHKREKIIIRLFQILIAVTFIFLWEYLSTHKIINSFIFSSPSKIVSTVYKLYLDNNIFNHLFTTIKEILISFSIGFIFSMFFSLLFYYINPIYKVFDPYITMLNSLPKVAIGPLILIWFGANTKSIIIMALLINLIVSTITIYTGFTKTDKNLLLLFKTFNASKLKTFIYLILPNSYMSIISSLKINLSMSFIGVIMGEFLVSKEGIGYLIIYGTQVFNLDLVLAGVVILVILSYIFYKPISILEKNIMKN